MVSILLTILGHLAYGTTNVLWKNPRNELGTLPLIIVRSFGCMLIFALAHLVLTSAEILAVREFTWIDLAQTIMICAVNYFGLFFFLKSMKHTPVSNTIGFGKIGLIIGVAVGYFVYDEEVSFLKLALCFAVLVAVTLIEISGRKSTVVLSKGLMYTILCKVFWATAYLYVPFIHKLGPMLFCVVLEMTVCVVSCLLFLYKPTKIEVKLITSRTKYEIVLLIMLGTLGTFCLNFALSYISIVLFAVIGLIEPLIGLKISKLYHKETLSPLQQTGIAVGILAAFILSVTK